MKSSAALLAKSVKPVKSVKKNKVLAYVNWSILDESGESLLKSSRGFPIFDNEYLSLEDKALIQLATGNDGIATVNAQLKVIVAQEKPESLDISRIKLVS